MKFHNALILTHKHKRRLLQAYIMKRMRVCLSTQCVFFSKVLLAGSNQSCLSVALVKTAEKCYVRYIISRYHSAYAARGVTWNDVCMTTACAGSGWWVVCSCFSDLISRFYPRPKTHKTLRVCTQVYVVQCIRATNCTGKRRDHQSDSYRRYFRPLSFFLFLHEHRRRNISDRQNK